LSNSSPPQGAGATSGGLGCFVCISSSVKALALAARLTYTAETTARKIPAFVFRATVFNWGMNAGQSIWDKLFRMVLSLLVLAGLLGIFLWYQPVIQENQHYRRDKLELEKKIEKEQEIARKLDIDLRAMQNPAAIERLARERLSYAKPGENVIHFDPPPGVSQTQ
jgi:cell division protein FtsB